MKLDIQKFAGTINFGTITENDPTMIDLNWGVFVANHSYVNIPVSGSNLIATRRLRLIIRSSTTSSYRAYEQTFSPTSTFNVTFSDCPITTSGTINIQVQAFGVSNQIVGSQSTTITANSYSNPRISNAIAKRVNSSNVESPNGEYLNYTFEGTIDSVSNHNAHTFRIGYRETGTTTYTYANVETSSYTCSKTNIFVPGWHLDAGKEYDIVFEAIDSFNTQSAIRNIESGFDLMNFNASGLAMAIGKVSEAGTNEEKLEVGIPSYFLDRVDVDGYIQQWNPNGRVGSGIIVRGNAQYPEASINYGNVNGNQAYIAGWGTAGIDGWNIWSAESGQNIVEVDKYGSLNVNGTYGHQARVRTKRNDTGADIEFGVGSDGVNRGIYDNGKGRWLFHTDNVSTFISPASGDYVFISNGSYWSYLTKKFIRARQTTSQAPDSNGQLNVLFQAVDINTASSALELKTDGKITIISNDVHHVKVDCTMWVERGSTSYAWCHLWVGGTDICSYMIPNRNNGEVWQSVHLSGIASVSYGTQITPSVYFNVANGDNQIRGGTYNGSVVIDVEVLD